MKNKLKNFWFFLKENMCWGSVILYLRNINCFWLVGKFIFDRIYVKNIIGFVYD